MTAGHRATESLRAQLILITGMIGVGKSTLATAIGRHLLMPVLGVDQVHAALQRTEGSDRIGGRVVAYQVVAALSFEQLRLGIPTIVDAGSAHESARQLWRDAASRAAVPLTIIELTCPDVQVLRDRLLSRVRDIEGYPEPTWEYVMRAAAGYAAWHDRRLTLNALTSESNIDEALRYIFEANDSTGRP